MTNKEALESLSGTYIEIHGNNHINVSDAIAHYFGETAAHGETISYITADGSEIQKEICNNEECMDETLEKISFAEGVNIDENDIMF